MNPRDHGSALRGCLLGTAVGDALGLPAEGCDTDTTGCVAGGLAGVCYGVEAIPPDWIATLARRDDVAVLFERFCAMMNETDFQ